MRDEKLYNYSVSWTQPYTTWPQTLPKIEPETEDLSLAREVLARIMAL